MYGFSLASYQVLKEDTEELKDVATNGNLPPYANGTATTTFSYVPLTEPQQQREVTVSQTRHGELEPYHLRCMHYRKRW